MLLDEKYAYLVGVILFVPVWLIIAIKRRDLIAEMIAVGLAGGLTSFFLTPYLLKDYWTIESALPVFGRYYFEDFLFGFIFCGISSVLLEVMNYKKHEFTHSMLLKPKVISLLAISFSPLSFFILNLLFRADSVISFLISILIGLLFIVLIRKDLFKHALISGLLLIQLCLLFYFFFRFLFPNIAAIWWNSAGAYEPEFLGVPLAEFAWFGLLGAFCSVVFKFIYDLKIVDCNCKK